jgi:uroporphyrinogen-III synthase
MRGVDPVWVMTRAQPEADEDVAALRAVGVAAISVPCIEQVALPWPEWRPEGPRVILVSSPFGAQQLTRVWPRLPEPKPAVAAMAPTTAARLEQAGIPVEIRAEGGIVALARAVQRWHLNRGGGLLAVLYATSDVGARQPEQEEALGMMRAFAKVDRVAVYSTRAPHGLEERLKALKPPVSLAFMSPSAVEHALPHLALVPSAVACIGQSTYRRFCELAANPPATPHSSFGAFVSALTKERS